MDQHDLPVGRQPGVGLEPARTLLERPPEGGEGVLGQGQPGPPVCEGDRPVHPGDSRGCAGRDRASGPDSGADEGLRPSQEQRLGAQATVGGCRWNCRGEHQGGMPQLWGREATAGRPDRPPVRGRGRRWRVHLRLPPLPGLGDPQGQRPHRRVCSSRPAWVATSCRHPPRSSSTMTARPSTTTTCSTSTCCSRPTGWVQRLNEMVREAGN